MVEKYTLRNGIPVFVVETSAAPVVSIQAWVSRGSIHETSAEAGISHFLEHALFKGTKKRDVGQIALEIESHGGEVNAFTSFEETVYYATLASRYLEEGLDVIADAILSPTFDATEMAREKEVILEEIKRAYDSPHKSLSMNLWANCFAKTAYGRPVLGSVQTVNRIDHRKLRAYHQLHYHAGTVALVVVGDVEAKKVVALAQSRLGKMVRRGKERLPGLGPLPTSRNQVGYVDIEKDVKECNVQIAFLAPKVSSPDVPALDILCSALGQGESSPLFQRLVKEKQVALDVHMGLVATNHCGLATLGLQVAPERLTEAVAECAKFLDEVAENGVRERDIERVKSAFESEVVGGKETVDGYARRLGFYHIQFGDPSYESRYLEQALAVTTADASESLQAVLRNRPVVSLVRPKESQSPKRELVQILQKSAKPAKQRKAAQKPTTAVQEKHNVRYVLKPLHSLPIINIRFLFAGGSREEAKDQLGLSSLFQRIWTSGTPSFTSLEIAHRLESLGASLYSFSGRNRMGLSVEFLAKQWGQIKPLLTEILLQPTFPEEEFKTEKHLLLREILSERDSPGQVCQLNWLNLLYGDHPNGRSALGNSETVTRLQTDHLRNHYREFIHRRHLVVASVGAFDNEDWLNELDSLCSRIPASGREPRELTAVRPIDQVKIHTEVKTPLFQSQLLIGFLGTTFQDEERYALKVLSSALSGQGGRLFLELRDKQSLAYTVAPLNQDGPERGLFGFYIGCGPEKLSAAIIGIRTELNKILERPLPSQELKRAKEFWIGRFELEMQRYSAQAMLLGLDEAYGLGFNHSERLVEKVKGLSAETIRAAARKILQPQHACISIVHPEPLSHEEILRLWTGASR